MEKIRKLFTKWLKEYSSGKHLTAKKKSLKAERLKFIEKMLKNYEYFRKKQKTLVTLQQQQDDLKREQKRLEALLKMQQKSLFKGSKNHGIILIPEPVKVGPDSLSADDVNITITTSNTTKAPAKPPNANGQQANQTLNDIQEIKKQIVELQNQQTFLSTQQAQLALQLAKEQVLFAQARQLIQLLLKQKQENSANIPTLSQMQSDGVEEKPHSPQNRDPNILKRLQNVLSRLVFTDDENTNRGDDDSNNENDNDNDDNDDRQITVMPENQVVQSNGMETVNSLYVKPNDMGDGNSMFVKSNDLEGNSMYARPNDMEGGNPTYVKSNDVNSMESGNSVDVKPNGMQAENPSYFKSNDMENLNSMYAKSNDMASENPTYVKPNDLETLNSMYAKSIDIGGGGNPTYIKSNQMESGNSMYVKANSMGTVTPVYDKSNDDDGGNFMYVKSNGMVGANSMPVKSNDLNVGNSMYDKENNRESGNLVYVNNEDPNQQPGNALYNVPVVVDNSDLSDQAQRNSLFGRNGVGTESPYDNENMYAVDKEVPVDETEPQYAVLVKKTLRSTIKKTKVHKRKKDLKRKGHRGRATKRKQHKN